MYLFYMDESGEREYTSSSRYFVICTIGVSTEDWKQINGDILVLKKTYFQDVNVEIKSNWFRIPKERERRYLLPYKINNEGLVEFIEKLYSIILGYNIVIISSVVDKEQMKKKYKTPQSPSSLAYRHIFERIELYLQNYVNSYGVLIFDKITEFELEKKGYEDLLTRQHLKYLSEGTDFVNVNKIVEGLLLIPSHENNFLQLVDICAYNVYRQFRDYGEEWNIDKSFKNKYKYFELIESKLYKLAGGHYAGYGIKIFP